MKIAIASLCVAAASAANWNSGWSQPQSSGWSGGWSQPQTQGYSSGWSQPQSSGWNGGWSQPQSSGWSSGWSQPSGWGGGYSGWGGYPHPHPHPSEEEEEVPVEEEEEGHGWDFHKYNGHIPHYHDFSYDIHDDLDWQLEDNEELIARLQADVNERNELILELVARLQLLEEAAAGGG